MIDTVIQVTCDWCGYERILSKKLPLLKGIGEVRFINRLEKEEGWLKFGDYHFCDESCFEEHKKDLKRWKN